MAHTPYPKINTVFKRDKHGLITPGEWARPEFAYLADLPWFWTEKIDGLGCWIHWEPGSGEGISMGTHTGRALPEKVRKSLQDRFLHAENLKRSKQPVTIYGEMVGSGIQRHGKQYGLSLRFYVFDIAIGKWFLGWDEMAAYASRNHLLVVPPVGDMTLHEAIGRVRENKIPANIPYAATTDYQPEGMVGRPQWGLRFDDHTPILVKIKHVDFVNLRNGVKKKHPVPANALKPEDTADDGLVLAA